MLPARRGKLVNETQFIDRYEVEIVRERFAEVNPQQAAAQAMNMASPKEKKR